MPTTLYLDGIVWWLSHCKYKSMWVGFLYTDVLSLPSSFGGDENVQERHGSISSGVFTDKLKVRINGIYVIQEAASVGCFDDGECIINISFPQRKGAW